MSGRPVILRFVGDTSNLSAAFSRVAAQSAATEGTISSLSSGLLTFGRHATAIGLGLTATLSFPIVAVGAAATNMAMEFEDAMNKIVRLVGVSQEQVSQWSGEILKLAPQVGVAPKELAEGLYFVTSSGIDASHAMEVLTASARGSAVGLGSTATVADAVTSALNAYGYANLSASKATDILLAAVREGKTEPEELSRAIGKVIAPAQALGVEFDQVAGAIASMSLVGLTASESATALRQALMTIMKPSTQTTKEMKDLGIEMDTVRKIVAENGLIDGLKYMRDATGGNTEALGKLFPNIRALNGVMIMTGENLGNTERIMGELAAASGDTDRAFAELAQTSKFKFAQATAALKAAGIELGTILIPYVTKAAVVIRELAEKFSNLSPHAQKLVMIGAGIAAALGPVLVIVGMLATTIGFLLSPVGLVLVGIAALAVAFKLAYDNVKPFRDGLHKIFDRLPAAVATAQQWIARFREGLGEAFQVVQGWITEHQAWWDSVVASVMRVVDRVVPAFRAGWDALSAIVAWVVYVIQDLWDRFGGHLVDHAVRMLELTVKFFVDSFNSIMRIIEGALQVITGIFNVFAGIFTGDWSRVWDGVKQIFSGVWDMIAGFVELIWTRITFVVRMGLEILSTVIGAAMALISSVWFGAWHWVETTIGKAFDSMRRLAVDGVGWIIDQVTAIPGRLAELPGKIAEATLGMWDGLKDAFRESINWIIRKWNDLSFSLPEVDTHIPGVGKVGGWSLDTPNIHPLANGGIITKPTLALIAEAGKEAAVPLENPRRARELLPVIERAAGVGERRGDGLSVTQNIYSLDSQMVARIAAEELAWQMKNTGY